ncbi:hypothetical protein ABXT72_00795 [Candidatus Pelagibacter sp. Uisw_094]|jgi:hypothetical protein|uniref:hypothetical protein n=1 Tax=Candidatus Pelagibacter sp. Uisw_094 TaxID=3230980 RepID=UPI0039EC6F52
MLTESSLKSKLYAKSKNFILHPEKEERKIPIKVDNIKIINTECFFSLTFLNKKKKKYKEIHIKYETNIVKELKSTIMQSERALNSR